MSWLVFVSGIVVGAVLVGLFLLFVLRLIVDEEEKKRWRVEIERIEDSDQPI
jgi:uncharacterized membrane protein (DUF106 family)